MLRAPGDCWGACRDGSRAPCACIPQKSDRACCWAHNPATRRSGRERSWRVHRRESHAWPSRAEKKLKIEDTVMTVSFWATKFTKVCRADQPPNNHFICSYEVHIIAAENEWKIMRGRMPRSKPGTPSDR